MAYEITGNSEYPIVLITLKGEIEARSVSPMLLECVGHLQDIEGLTSVVFDFTDVSTVAARKFAEALNVFHRTSPTFKPDAPIFYAFVGKNGASHETASELESLKFQVPLFKSTEEAVSYLNLRVSSAYLKQSARRNATDKLDTLHISSRHDNTAGLPDSVIPGSSIFPRGGVLRIESVETRQTMLLIPKGESVIGRQDASHQKPDIDLSMWGAFHHGVSREHALLVRTEATTLNLVDLNSSNGTALNGEWLEPECAYVLRDGDELTFGTLTIRLYFQETIDLS